jgi:hypothetical protein
MEKNSQTSLGTHHNDTRTTDQTIKRYIRVQRA